MSWAAFDIGSVRARLRASEAQSDAAAANYEKVVLTALEDTENSFVAYSARQAQLKSLSEQAQASRRAAELADTQYREGVADFLVLLDAQRTQLDAEDSVAQAETAVNVSVVAIYKALGGRRAAAAAMLHRSRWRKFHEGANRHRLGSRIGAASYTPSMSSR